MEIEYIPLPKLDVEVTYPEDPSQDAEFGALLDQFFPKQYTPAKYVPSEQKCWEMYNNGSSGQQKWAHALLTGYYGVDCDCANCSPLYEREIRYPNEK